MEVLKICYVHRMKEKIDSSSLLLTIQNVNRIDFLKKFKCIKPIIIKSFKKIITKIKLKYKK